MCYHDVWTDTSLSCSKLLDTNGCSDGIAMSSGWMLLTDERPDALLSLPDGNMGSDFYELESAQNLP
jgi:hypothetical protein